MEADDLGSQLQGGYDSGSFSGIPEAIGKATESSGNLFFPWNFFVFLVSQMFP